MYPSERYSVTFRYSDGKIRTDELGTLEQISDYAKTLEKAGHIILDVRNIYKNISLLCYAL